MKRFASHSQKQTEIVRWVQYVVMVLAFIGLWQLLSSGTTFVHRLF